MASFEETLIGQLLMWPSHIPEVKILPQEFTHPRCRAAFEAMLDITARDMSVDFLTVAEESGVPLDFLYPLTTDVTPNITWTVEKVREASLKHRLGIALRTSLEALADKSAGEVIGQTEDALIALGETMQTDITMLGDRAIEMVELFEQRMKATELPGITTGIEKLDTTIQGLEAQKYYVVGARPSRGKSALLLNMALKAGVPVGFVSIESGAVEILERSFAVLGNIEAGKLKTGFFANRDLHGIANAAEQLKGLPFYIADKPNMYLSELIATARQMVRKHGAQVLYIDYVQLVQVPGGLSDYERVSRVSVALKQLARELGVPVVVAAQLNRASEQSDERRPRLSDFKNSGQIEQDADVAILIHWSGESTFLHVEKNRDGACGDIRVHFNKPCVRFENWEA